MRLARSTFSSRRLRLKGRGRVALLVAQGFYRVETRGEVSGDQSGERTNQKSADADDGHILRHDLRRDFGELVDFTRKNFDVQGRGQPVAEFVAVTNQGHAEPETSQGAEGPDDRALTKKDPDDLRNVCAKRFHDPDFAPLLHRNRDERAHDSERGDHHDEEEQKKHNRALQPHRFEVLTIHIDPGLREFRRLEKLLDRLFDAVSAIRVIRFDRNAVERVAEAIKLLADVKRHDQKLRIMHIVAGLENPGDSEFFGQNNVPQLVDGLFFFRTLGAFELLNAVEDLIQVPR